MPAFCVQASARSGQEEQKLSFKVFLLPKTKNSAIFLCASICKIRPRRTKTVFQGFPAPQDKKTG
jgi:hypothetical protein